jgi:hypothetical protein
VRHAGKQHSGYLHESMAAGFTEFRNKTEFSDLPIAGKRLKSMVFSPTKRWPPMAPPLPKQGQESNLWRNELGGQSNKGLQPPTKLE